MTVWRGRLFGPALPPAGSEVQVALDNGTLSLRVAGEYPRRVSVSALAARYTGFNDSQFELAWRDGAGAWACHLDTPAEITALLAAWPVELAPLPRKLRRPRRHPLLSWAVVALVMAMPVLLLTAILLKQGQAIDFIVHRISPELERQIGAASLAQVRAATRFIEQGAQVQALAAVARQVVGDDAAFYRFHLADDKMVNAFAVPGGDIVVNRGLLAATRSPEELAGVLAHEIQHIALRHSLRGVVRGAGLSLLFTLVIGEPSATLTGQAADRLLNLKFSRDAEREADEHGFSLLLARGIDPHGMVAFFATLAKQDGATPPALLSTHPTSVEREAALAMRLEKLPANCCKLLVIDGVWPPL